MLSTAIDSQNRLTRGYLICLGGTVAWATTGIFIRYLTENYHLPSLVLAFWRDLFVSGALAAAFALLRPALYKIELRNLGFLVLYGLILAVFNSLWTFSVALNGAAVATVLAYSSPAFTALFAWRLLGERLSTLKLAVVITSMAGCILVSGAYHPAVWRLKLWGILVGLFSGLLFAAYNMMGKFALRRGVNSWSSLLYAFSFASVFLLGFNFIPGLAGDGGVTRNLLWLGSSLTGWGVLFVLGVGPSIAGFGLYTLSLGYLKASVANLIATLEPVLTAGMAYLILNEQMSGIQVTGSLLIILSVIILRLREKD